MTLLETRPSRCCSTKRYGTDYDNTGEFPVVLPPNVKSGDVLSMRVVVTGTDYETGYADSWEVVGAIEKE